MNGQSNGSPKGMLGKKMFSLIAVALMVASCLVVVAAVDDSSAKDANAYSGYVLSFESGLHIEGQDPKIPGVTLNLENNKMIFDNVNVIIEDYEFIHVAGGAVNDNNVINLEFHGKNVITVKSTSTMLYGILTDNCVTNIIGIDGASLTIICQGTIGETACKALHGDMTIKDIDININFQGTIQNISGIEFGGYESNTVSGSNIVVGSADECVGVTNYVGVSTSVDLDIVKSNIIVNQNDPGQLTSSVGMVVDQSTESTPSITIDKNSFVLLSGSTNAFCGSIEVGSVKVKFDIPNTFKDNGISGDLNKWKDCDFTPITDDTISRDYKSVMIGTPGHTLSFDKDGGEGRAPESVTLASGEHYTIPACKLTKDGSSADGWVDSNGKVYHAGDDFVMGDSDVVLKPHWNTGIGISMTILAIIIFFSILLIIGIVFAVRKYEE